MPPEVQAADSLLEEARAALRDRRVHDALQLCDRAALQGEHGRYRAARLRGDILLDLGDAKGALSSFDSVADPSLPDPSLDCARGLALFELARLAEADNALRSALRGDPELADAHFTLGLIAELQHTGDENEYFRRARKLSPERFPAAGKMPTALFETAVAAAASQLPKALAERMHKTPILIAELPNPRDLTRAEMPVSPLTFAMRVAIRTMGDHPDEPLGARPALLLFKRNFERAHHNADGLVEAIAQTLRKHLEEMA